MLYLIVLSSLISFASAGTIENRCGWWDNSTPGNVDFSDKDGEWVVSQQGGYEAKGNWGPSGEHISTNRNYGKYCVCIKVEVNKSQSQISIIHSGKTKKLKDCLNDRKLPGHQASAAGALKEFTGQWVSKNEDCLPNRLFLIQAKQISIGGDGVYDFKVVKEKPLWIELENAKDPADKYQRLTKKTHGQIEMRGSTLMKEEPDGVECILGKK